MDRPVAVDLPHPDEDGPGLTCNRCWGYDAVHPCLCRPDPAPAVAPRTPHPGPAPSAVRWRRRRRAAARLTEAGQV